MDEKQVEDLELEDILKEFSKDEEQDPQQLKELEELPVWEGTLSRPLPVAESVTQETLRLDDLSDKLSFATDWKDDATIAFTPVGEQWEQAPVPVPEEPQVEPYSSEWEPDYEQPIGEYVPPEPIVFRPKSRLRELKRKLIAGPEKRYYELAEQGLGKLQLAILGNFLVAAVSVAVTALYSTGVIGPDRIRFAVFTLFLTLLLSAALGSYQLMEGFADIFKKRFSLNSLLIFSLLACLIDGMLCLKQERIPCCAAFSLNMLMSLWSAYQKRNTEMGQMDTLRKATCLDKLASVPDYYEEAPGLLRSEGQVEDFMDTYQQVSGPEKVLSVYALVALLVSVAIGVAAGYIYELSVGLQFFAAALLVSVPASAYITLSRPMAVLERRFHKQGTVLCGWDGVKGLCERVVFPVSDEDLFPNCTVKMNGVKFYGKRDPDEVVAYAAALVSACGGTMEPLFTQLLESRNGYHYETEQLKSYVGGIGAVINDEAVLAGTLSFMQDMGVDMPEGTRVSQAVYVAINGSLSGVFAFSYAKVKTATVGLTTLCAYRGLTPVLIGGDFMLTESFLRSKFGVNTRRMVFPNWGVRQQLREKKPQEEAKALALMTQDGLLSAAYAATGARALRTAMRAGVAVHMLGGILGLVIMLVLALVNAHYLLTPTNMLLYVFLWMIPGVLITEWTRSV